MKKTILTAVFLLTAVFSVYAQDRIVFRDGNIIEAKIIEISPTEIRYKNFDNLEGPTIVIYKTNVLTIQYENGTYEIINSDAPAGTAVAERDPNRLIVGLNANPGGLLTNGAAICIEFTKANFNSEISLIYPAGLSAGKNGGFGILFTFNRFWHSNIGGFYLGGGIGYTWKKDAIIVSANNANSYYDGTNWIYRPNTTRITESHLTTFGINLGYKFVLSSGMYFRAGGYASLAVDWALLGWEKNGWSSNSQSYSFYAKPDLAIGWTVR